MNTPKKQVIVVRGIPGSGKTTWVKSQMTETSARINNDDIGAMMFTQTQRQNKAALMQELRVTLLRKLLCDPEVDTIFVDNTNLVVKTVNILQRITFEFGADFKVVDDFLLVPVELCIERDATRPVPIGEAIIRKMHTQAVKLRPWTASSYPAITPYANDTYEDIDGKSSLLPVCVIVDIDGTLAIKGDRDIYDYSLVGLDTPNKPVVEVIKSLAQANYRIIYMSGRDGSAFTETLLWLKTHVHTTKEDPQLFMRKASDKRPDWIVKYELFTENIAGKYHILAVFDDRDQVVNLWRNRLQLPTLQVAEGNF
jgi:predicted kinase